MTLEFMYHQQKNLLCFFIQISSLLELRVGVYRNVDLLAGMVLIFSCCVEASAEAVQCFLELKEQ